jgi:3-methylcrotonyl-CoA carboxylase alpha subunit
VSDAVGPGEAARRLGVSTRTVQRWLREGRLPAVRVGAHTKVLASALPGATPVGRITRLLVANRGELVVRIARTCRQLGIAALALVAQDQARAWWTRAADELVPLNDASYLDQAAVLGAARAARADALHPGYGFLAENPDFAQAVIDAGLIWVGPPPQAMRTLGDKSAARQMAETIGVPVLPGYDGPAQDDQRLAREARRIGYPVLLKPSAGGGGKGMHLVERAVELSDSLARARREAAAAFGDDRLVIERYLPRPHHVEIQFLADRHGYAIHLGERECSLQRRHQKVIEESPSPIVDEALRARLGGAALALATAAGYQGAGTAEFLVDGRGDFYFLEVNARLQVEHPVTELVTGRDLVADQLAIAQGQHLGTAQGEVHLSGHAVEARLYAEDARSGFLPATGEVLDVRWPDIDGLRVDAGVGAGDVVGTRYDPLLAKLITHGQDRPTALSRLGSALNGTRVLGITTNRGFLRWLVEQPEVGAGLTNTELIDERWQPRSGLPDEAWAAAAAALAASLVTETGSRVGFRVNAPARLRVRIGQEQRSVEVRPSEAGAQWMWLAAGDESVVLDVDGEAVRAHLARPPSVEAAVRQAGHGQAAQHVTAPMPGSVLAIRVKPGEEVEAGQVLLVLEAMKMENGVPAPGAGQVVRVLVAPGAQVQRGETLIELA